MHNQSSVNSLCFLREVFPEGAAAERCLGSLTKLSRHLKRGVVLTGGIALGWHLLVNGLRPEKQRFNDIDVVVEDLYGLQTSLGREFLIAHFHPRRERGKILIQLVDQDFRTRIDVFTPSSDGLMERLGDSAVDDAAYRCVPAEDLLAKLLSIIYRAARGEAVEPKYVRHFRRLFKVTESHSMREVWREYRKEGEPLDFYEAAAAVDLSLKANPGLLREEQYNQDAAHNCPWCQEAEEFPLAPRHMIYQVLGYV